MFTHQNKIYIAIAVISVAVILLGIASFSFFADRGQDEGQLPSESEESVISRHPLTGVAEEDSSFFPVAVMIDNSYDVRTQYGLSQAAVVYEALVEGNITRLMAIFDSREGIDKLGPVRSARPYFLDWADEYGGVYMHVGGSPQALGEVVFYDFVDIDQIGAGEIYFWRDNDLYPPQNVFTSSSNWLRVGELKEVADIESEPMWNFVDFPEEYPAERSYMPPLSFVVDFSIESYQVEWKFNQGLNMYQRWQGGDKHIYDTGEQIAVKNVLIQVAPSRIIDDKERREMDNRSEGVAYLVNPIGYQEGTWKYENGRTLFYDENDEPMQMAPGKTWIEVVSSEEDFILE